MTNQEAIRLAIEHIQGNYTVSADSAIKALEEALAKQEQGEPVAIVDANDDGYWAEILPDRSVKVGQLLYTTPQQRTWVGLTDKEMLECNMDDDFMIDRETAKRNVEAKLKEMNK
jgi:hypothetical protein